jgi:hypothetical protein
VPPGAVPWVPSQPGQAPSAIPPGQAPGAPPALAPVQTPEAAAAPPQTEAFSQAPAAGGAAAFTFAPFMIGDQGISAVVRPSTPTPVNPVLARPGGAVAAIAQAGRGAFKITENESPRPIDRVFFNYNYFNRVGTGVPDLSLFDIHRETFGFEKTFLDGDASAELRVSVLQQNSGDGTLGATDFSSLTFVSKFALINNRETGNLLSTGMAVTVPTGPAIPMPTGSGLNSTLLQPFAGYIYVLDRLYVQGFSSLIIPTDSRDVLLLANSTGVGYFLYQAPNPGDRLISYVIPTIEGHSTVPLNHRGSDSFPVGFPDLFVLTNGVHIGVGRASNFTVGLAVPLTGPKLYNYEAFAQFNWRF